MQFFKLVIITTALTTGLIGQDAPVPPVQAKRLPADKTKRKVPPGSDNLIDRYDFGAQVNALQDTNSVQGIWFAGSQSDVGIKSGLGVDW